MRIDLDAKVLSREGEHVGSVERAVVDPATNRVTEFVISTGSFFGRDVLLPREEIDRADASGDTIRLRLGKDEIKQLPDYLPDRYALPPIGWAYPGAYTFGTYGGFVWPAAFAYDQPTIAAGTAEGWNDQPDQPSIGKGAIVVDRSGEELGVVDDVRLDAESGRLRGFVLRIGGTLRTLLGGGETVEVSTGAVDAVEEGLVRLRLSTSDLESISAD